MGRILTICHFILSGLIALSLMIYSPNHRRLDACLGTYEKNFFQTIGSEICSLGDSFQKFLCHISLGSYLILSSNVLEIYMLYSCFKAIKNQTDKVHELIGAKNYQKRRRDDGIVISISVFQWFTEVLHYIFFNIYVAKLNGISNLMDKELTKL